MKAQKRGYLIAGVLVMMLAAVMVVWEANKMTNDEIDLCDDPTSGRYIVDDIERAKACDREPMAKSPD